MMRHAINTGKWFYALAIVTLGLLNMYYGVYPYMLVPATGVWLPEFMIGVYVVGALFIASGVGILFGGRTYLSAIVLGTLLLLILLIGHIPYEILGSGKSTFLTWENVLKVVALAGGALVIAGLVKEDQNTHSPGVKARLISVGMVLYSIAILSFALNHFLYVHGVESYTPKWIPFRLFWAYFTGIALLGSGISVLFRIKLRVITMLLSLMILIWIVVLHIPRILVSPPEYLNSEIASTCLALAYCGTALTISGLNRHGTDSFIR
ncbi:MAG: hypothetical protein U0289_06955 [Cyclobacteriaceae bacterium]|mgnify:CR=1 FL=1|jgi:uncharacterized membrane protein|nr:hypothetical protein [Cytophagales bacterium]HNP77693.1 hypothetical protein [Cyclobacteriaceae bacterium]